MPQLQNMTVKKADGTTDIVWTGVVPSSGDKTPAKYVSNTSADALGHRSYMTVQTRDNGARTGRVLTIIFTGIHLGADANGADIVSARQIFSVTGTIPTNISTVAVKELWKQFVNLLDHDHITAVVEEGYAAT